MHLGCVNRKRATARSARQTTQTSAHDTARTGEAEGTGVQSSSGSRVECSVQCTCTPPVRFAYGLCLILGYAFASHLTAPRVLIICLFMDQSCGVQYLLVLLSLHSILIFEIAILALARALQFAALYCSLYLRYVSYTFTVYTAYTYYTVTSTTGFIRHTSWRGVLL